MPAAKPVGLNERHSTRAEIEEREAGEESMRPGGRLQASAPSALKGHEVASREWRSLIKLYSGLEAEIVSRLDMAILLDYCILVEQIGELDDLRKMAFSGYDAAKKVLTSFEADGVDVKLVARAVDAMNTIFDNIVKLDGRVDRKRALLHTLRQSLYLTPRARAGVAPKSKEAEAPKSELDQLLLDGM